MNVGIVAPSFVVPVTELKLGVELLESAGLDVAVHPQCRSRHLFYAGDDMERAQAFYEMAMDPDLDVLVAARGGAGATRLLSLLDDLVAKKGKPLKGKLLAGYSDASALMEYVRTRWNWRTMHAPMPGGRSFALMTPDELKATLGWMKGEPTKAPWSGKKLKFFHRPPGGATITGELVGGNLSVWTAMVGTPFAGNAQGKILFLEDIGEALYRVDRLIQQVLDSGGFKGVRALVLGEFVDCEDRVAKVLAKVPPRGKTRNRVLKSPKPAELKPLRPTIAASEGLKKIFEVLGARLGIPVAYGLPVGHGSGRSPLPLGAEYRLDFNGRFDLVRWDWTARKS